MRVAELRRWKKDDRLFSWTSAPRGSRSRERVVRREVRARCLRAGGEGRFQEAASLSYPLGARLIGLRERRAYLASRIYQPLNLR